MVRDAARGVRLVESVALVASPMESPTDLKGLSHADLLSKSLEMQVPRARSACCAGVSAPLESRRRESRRY